MTGQTPGTGPGQGSGRDRTTNCPDCGARTEPGQSFCDSCGGVLGWTAEQPERSSARTDRAYGQTPAPAPGRDANSPADGGSSRARAQAVAGTSGAGAGGTGGTGAGPDSPTAGSSTGTGTNTGAGTGVGEAGAAAGGPSSVPPPQTAPPAGPSAGRQGAAEPDGGGNSGSPDAGWDGPKGTADETDAATAAVPGPPAEPDDTVARARSLLVPVEEPEPAQPAQPSVTPVLPGRPDADRPHVRGPATGFREDGGEPCPWCATPNRPDRHFCGRCAMPMTRSEESPAAGPRPWWRRLRTSRNRETPWAGDRPRLRRGFGRILNWVVGALVLGLLAAAVLNAETAYHAVRDHFAKRAPVGPDEFKASRSYPDHGPELAFDKLNNTWWGPGVTESGAGEWVEARFEQPTRLLDVIITPGVSTKPDELSKSALPHRVEATITKADGKKETRILTLDQGAGGQLRSFTVGSVSAVRFTVRSAYGASSDKQLSIAEIEFFGPSSGSTT